MAISRRLRFEVLRRDGHTCRYCGAKAPDVALTVDHVIPETLGGSNDPSNLVTACQPCNAGKSSIAPGSPLVADVEADAIRWSRAIEMAAWYRKIDRQVMDDEVRRFDEMWCGWTVRSTGESIPKDEGWQDSVERFLSLGLTQDDFSRLTRRSMTQEKLPADSIWRYFCGCCWRSITDLQESARLYLEANPDG